MRQEQVEQPFGNPLLCLGLDLLALLLFHEADGALGQVADHALDVAADVADFGVLRRSTLRNGAPTSSASRRAISVFPTPVGPIMMMFFGVTSLRSAGGSCCRRQRLRMATATARLAAS